MSECHLSKDCKDNTFLFSSTDSKLNTINVGIKVNISLGTFEYDVYINTPKGFRRHPQRLSYRKILGLVYGGEVV